MAPGGMSAGATSPGMTNSSPVENKATLGRATTCRWDRPKLAANPNCAGPSFWPRWSTVSPARTSSPLRRTHCPASAVVKKRTKDQAYNDLALATVEFQLQGAWVPTSY